MVIRDRNGRAGDREVENGLDKFGVAGMNGNGRILIDVCMEKKMSVEISICTTLLV